MQFCPSRILQAWFASQDWSDGQVSSGRPTGTSEQVPSLPATLQARQVPAHWAAGTAQQTPSTQLPDRQLPAEADEQPAPFARGALFGMYSQNLLRARSVGSAGTEPPNR